MDFVYDEVIDLWVADSMCQGKKIKVRLYCRKDADLKRLGTKVIEDVERHWDFLKTAVTSQLLPKYNHESNQQLTDEEFFSRLVLKTIDFDARDIMYTLFWSDSGLFGGHSIQVLWDPGEKFRADVSLVG